MKAIRDVRPGDRFYGFGPGWTVERVQYLGELDMGGNLERQRYGVHLVGTVR